METTKLERLEKLHKTILDCKRDYPDLGFDDMLHECRCYIRMEKERLDFHSVYPISSGCSTEAVFEGTREQCDRYLADHPELKGNCLVLGYR